MIDEIRVIVDEVPPVTASEARDRASAHGRARARRRTLSIAALLVIGAVATVALWRTGDGREFDVATSRETAGDSGSARPSNATDDRAAPCEPRQLQALHDDVMQLRWVDSGHVPNFGAVVNEPSCTVDIESTDLTPSERRRLEEIGGNRLRIIDRPVENLGGR